jgi:hypothetical protein
MDLPESLPKNSVARVTHPVSPVDAHASRRSFHPARESGFLATKSFVKDNTIPNLDLSVK